MLVHIASHMCDMVFVCFFFQAEYGIRDLGRSRGLGDVYKRQAHDLRKRRPWCRNEASRFAPIRAPGVPTDQKVRGCLLYTSDAADERSSVDLGGRRIIKKKKDEDTGQSRHGKHK